MVVFSQLIIEQPAISEIDINPLLASAEGFLALDARVLLHDFKDPKAESPRAAIRPYPSQYVRTLRLQDGTAVTLRPRRPEEEPLMIKFHETLSGESVYYRYFTALQLPQRIAHERLTRICFNDYDREIALVVEHKSPRNTQREILAVGRLIKAHGANEGEFALLVSDQRQKHGLGTELLKSLIEVGRQEKLDRIVGHILPENHAMQNISKCAGFSLKHNLGTGEVLATIELKTN